MYVSAQCGCPATDEGKMRKPTLIGMAAAAITAAMASPAFAGSADGKIQI